eukprot:2814655-Amphidinium_carterae.2
MCKKKPHLWQGVLIQNSRNLRKSLDDLARCKVPLNSRSTVELAWLLKKVVWALKKDSNRVSLISSGEAHGVIKMGAGVIFSTLNVGCLTSKIQGISELLTDFCALQEVGILQENTPSVIRHARSLALQMSFGPCPSSFRDTLGRKNHNKSLVVGMTARAGLGLGRSDSDFLASDCPLARLSSFSLVKKDWECIVHVMYFLTGVDEAAAGPDDRLRAELIRRVTLKSDRQQMIAGDFQGPPYEDLGFRQLFQQGWLSAVQVGEVPFTNSSGPDAQAVLDDVLVCPLQAQRLEKVQASQISGFSSHSVLSLSFGSAEVDRSGWRFKLPAEPPRSEWGQVVRDMAITLEEWWQCDMCSAQAIYDHWLDGLNAWVGVSNEDLGRTEARKGNADYFFDVGTPLAIKGSSSQTWKIHVLKKALSWSKEIKGHRSSGCHACPQCTHLLAKVSRLPWSSVAPHLSPPHRGRTHGSIWSTRYSDAPPRTRTEALSNGKSACLTPLSKDRRSWHIHPPSILSALRDCWEPVLKPDDPALDEDTLVAAISRLPSVPLDLPPIQPDDLHQAVIKRKKSSKGLAGIDIEELRALPRNWSLICSVINRVENGEQWPCQFLEVRLAPIPKGEGGGVTASNKVLGLVPG